MEFEHHRVLVDTPVGVITLLRACPTLLTVAVQSYHRRDDRDQQACDRMLFFPPETRVRGVVSFPRYLFAYLRDVTYEPNPLTGWTQISGGQKINQQLDLGIKLACGFEILVTRARPTPGMAYTAPSIKQLQNDTRWQRYLSSLQERNYFQETKEDSEAYTELMEKAHGFFIATTLNEHRSVELGLLTHQLLFQLRPDRSQWKDGQLPLAEVDDESWIEDSGVKLKQIAEEKLHTGLNYSEEVTPIVHQMLTLISKQEAAMRSDPARRTSRARKMSRKMSTPLRKLSQISNASDVSTLSANVDLNGSYFSESMTAVLDFSEDDSYWSDDEDSTGMSSYGDDENDLYDLEMALNLAKIGEFTV